MMTLTCPYCGRELVQVDNPVRREIRHRRGEEALCPGPPSRVWYGLCTYWTEDFTKLLGPGVPLCPSCGSPGFESTREEWDVGVAAFEAEHPGYTVFLETFRETCRGRGVTIMDLWRRHEAERA